MTHGTYDKEIIRRVIRQHMAELKYCYETELQHDDTLDGRILARFSLNSDGRVVTSGIQSSTMHAPKVESCVANVFQRLEFARMPGGNGLTTVTYPLSFHRAGG